MTVKNLCEVFGSDDLEKIVFSTIDSKFAYYYTAVPEDAKVLWIKPDYYTGRLTVYVKCKDILDLQ